MSKATATERAQTLLELVELTDAADRLIKGYSGGMKRRLDLASALVHEPEVLFLDEPTTGLDPRSRGELWEIVRQLVREGTTVILTTQYLDEADKLADDIVVLDHGSMVAHGTPAELKARIGTDRVDVTVASTAELHRAGAALEAFTGSRATLDAESFVATAPVSEGTRLIDVLRAVEDAGVDALDLNRRQPTLDDVFLTLTADHDGPAPRLEVPA